MKITIIDGSPGINGSSSYSDNLAASLKNAGHKVRLFKACDMNIKSCQGCWNCWWKTPGECTFKDDMPLIYKSYIDSDLIIHYSPIKEGFVSSELKTIIDRSVPLVHPYVAIVNKECHHRKRYSKYPQIGLIVDRCDADDEELEITRDIYSRFALNYKSNLSIFATTKKTQEEIINEISCI